MAYTAPRTWSPGETVTASLMNAHVRDNLNAIAAKALVVAFGSPVGDVMTTGVKAYVEIPFPCKVVGWTILADASGSAVVDVWKDTYANFPPTVADTIAGSEKPTLSGAQKNQDNTLSTWANSGNLDAGDVLAFNVDSAATVKQLIVTLRLDPR